MHNYRKQSFRLVIAAAAVAAMFSFSRDKASAEVLTWDCAFSTRSTLDGIAEEGMILVFKVDTLNRRAYMEGNLGIVPVETHIGDNAFSFIEQLDSGAVQTTTISRDGSAVHSRNTVMLGEIVAAQHFGHCTFR